MSVKCDIIIPVYNAHRWLELCIESIFLSDISKRVNKVIIVDDCSDEPTKQLIGKMADDNKNVTVITNTENLGFVKTCNKGMSATSSEYIMLLNSDCLLAEDSTRKLLDIPAGNPEIGLVSPLSNNAANLSVEIPAGYDYIKLDKLFEKHFTGKSFNACTIVGNCLVISRDCYEKTGQLDESYGKGYGEETDYQYRAKQSGFRAVVAVDTYVFHKSEISFTGVADLDSIKKRNAALFHSKWGKQYSEDFKAYKKNDPVDYVLNNLNDKDYMEFLAYRSDVFSEGFIDRVILLDREGQSPAHLRRNDDNRPLSLFTRIKLRIRRIINLYRSKGAKFVFIKSLHVVARRFEKIYENAMEGMKNSHCRDFVFIYESNPAKEMAVLYTEKLGYYGISTDLIEISNLSAQYLKRYRGFIFTDCVFSESAGVFISEAGKLNKTVLWICGNEDILSSLSRGSVNGIITTKRNIEELAVSKGFSAHYVEESFLNSMITIEAPVEKGLALKEFLCGKLKSNIAFILPSTMVCGGLNVVTKHCEVLQRNGYDVFIINMERDDVSRFCNGREIPVISIETTKMECMLDKVVSTMWVTVNCMDGLPAPGSKLYLVQGFETDFYGSNDPNNRMSANSTYARNDIKYLTVSAWCKRWLKEFFRQEAGFIRNGMDISAFKKTDRDFTGRITVLIEGDCEAEYKNVDESFTITNKLDPEKFEIVYLSNRGMPKKWYRYDRLYYKIPYEEVTAVYGNAHILLKTSLFESFSYPLLEMMATGGVVIAVQNDGNREFAVNNYNCLIYEQGNISDAIGKIEMIREDEQLRNRLIENGVQTAKERAWEFIEPEIMKGYYS